MKTSISVSDKYYYYEIMINNNDKDYITKCLALEADGYRMENNGWPEDGENYTIYMKTIKK